VFVCIIMHGRLKKDQVQLPPEELEKQKQQVRTAGALFKGLLAQRQADVYSEQTLDTTMKALQFHPEFPTLWSYRRDMLSGKLPSINIKQALGMEMKLLEKALRKTQKVYSIWFHRKWAVEQLFKLCGTDVVAAQQILDNELELCGKLLEVDERNFHCWNHRAHVLGLMRQVSDVVSQREQEAPQLKDSMEATFAPPDRAVVADKEAVALPEEQPKADDGAGTEDAPKAAPAEIAKPSLPNFTEIDLKLSKDLINRNFSNYSAWHLRALLQQVHSEEAALGSGPIDVESELEWVQQGIYTEPNDQSVWLYHHWLTTLGRGREQARITHCAALGGELFVFFSKQVCASRSLGSETKVKMVGAEQRVLQGRIVPLGPDVGSAVSGACRRTRRLSGQRRRWSCGWRFVPETAFSSFASGTIELETFVEEVGSHADGSPSCAQQKISFSGHPVLCDPDDASASKSSPALKAALLPPPDAKQLEVLQGELTRVEELLEIEPDCRWALLAQGRLAVAAAAGAGAEAMEAAEKMVGAGYKHAAQLDPLRAGFYEEAQAASSLRLRVLTWLQNECHDLSSQLTLSDAGLTRLPPSVVLPLFGVRRLDFSGSKLRELGPLLQLESLEELNVSRNCLSADVRELFCFPRLKKLNAGYNSMQMRAVEGEGSGEVVPPSSLTELDISGNRSIVQLLECSGPAGVLARLQGGEAWLATVDALSGSCVLHRKAL